MLLRNQIKFIALLALVSSGGFAQGIRPESTNEAARKCFVEADIVSTVNQVVVTYHLEPCDVAIEEYGLAPQDRAASFANRGILHAANGALAEALSDYDEALNLSPDLAEVYVSRGIIYHFLRDYQRAIEDYTHAINLHVSNRHVAYLDRGMAYEELDRFAEAAEDYQQALEHRHEWPPATVRLRWVLEKLSHSTATATAR